MLQVQVNHGAWGFVCDDQFDANDNGAEIICKRLGWAGPVGTATHCDANVGTDEFALDDLVRPPSQPVPLIVGALIVRGAGYIPRLRPGPPGGPAALPPCTTAHPLHTRLSNTIIRRLDF